MTDQNKTNIEKRTEKCHIIDEYKKVRAKDSLENVAEERKLEEKIIDDYNKKSGNIKLINNSILCPVCETIKTRHITDISPNPCYTEIDFWCENGHTFGFRIIEQNGQTTIKYSQ